MRTMKSKSLQVFLILSTLFLTSCLPDSFTKFKEDPPQLGSSGGGSSSGGSSSTFTEAPDLLSYGETENSDYTIVLAVGNPVSDFIVTSIANGVESYSVTPALPDGLSLNTTTGEITGTPTAYTPTANYIVTASNPIGDDTTTLTITVINRPSGLRVSTTPYIKLTVVDASNFSIGGFISSQTSGSGSITAISGNEITVSVTSGTFSSTTGSNGLDNVASFVAADTTIEEVNFLLRQKLKISSTSGLILGSTISNSLGHYGEVTEVINSTEILVGIYLGTFNANDGIDDTFPYVAAADTISEMGFIYLADESIDIRPTLTVGENISYSVSNDLPANFTELDENFGFIQGTQNSTQLVPVTLLATNEAGSTNTSFTIGPEESAPKNMNFAQELVINVTSTSPFTVGENISSSGVGSGGNNGLGTILRIIDSNNLHVRLINGFFNTGEGIDNVSPYGGEKAIIGTVSPVSIVLYVPDGGGANFARNSFISSSSVSSNSTGKGIVSFMDPNGASEDILYVLTYSGTFIVADPADVLSIDNEENYAAQETTVNRIVSNNMRLKLTSAASFSKGSEITSLGDAAGIVNDVDYFNNYVYVEVDNNGFTFDAATDDVDNYNPYNAAEAQITEIARDNTFYLYRDEKIRINAFLRKGSNPTWTVVPNLPDGLTLDPNLGHISGTPIESSAKKPYTVTASNFIDGVVFEESFTFFLQVFDHFSVSNVTSGATSYILHKEGKKNGSAKCRVTADQVALSGIKTKDVICRLEAEEKDIFNEGIELEINSSAGLCQFVEHRPYYFYSRPVSETTNHTVYVKHQKKGEAECNVPQTSDTIPSGVENLACIADYTSTNLTAGKKNCDDGSYLIKIVEWSGAAAGVDCPTSEVKGEIEVVECNGNFRACREGPVRDIDINADIFSFVTMNSSLGLVKKFSYKPPINAGDIRSTLRLSNYVGSNNCSDSASGTENGYLYNANNWANYSSSGYNQAGAANAAQVTFAARDETSTILARKSVTASEDISSDFKVGDIVEINYGGTLGFGHHKIESITGGTNIVFANPIDFSIPAGSYDISLDFRSEPFKGAQPFYVFECQDAAADTIARIRIQVRDWDRRFSLEDDIDKLGTKITGTVSSNMGAAGLTGAATLFSTELTVGQTFRFGSQRNQVASITNDTNLVMENNATDTLAGQDLFARPILMDTGELTDAFSQYYNDHPDWDNYSANTSLATFPFNSGFPYLNSCGVGTPVHPNQDRDNFYRFPFDAYIP